MTQPAAWDSSGHLRFFAGSAHCERLLKRNAKDDAKAFAWAKKQKLNNAVNVHAAE